MSREKMESVLAPRTFGRDQVVSIINSVIGKVNAPQELPRDLICRELNGLKETIEALREQLQVSAPGDISRTHIPTAKDELDAVIETTEQATNTIMTACESVLANVRGGPPAISQSVEADIVRIFEACTFQDITGQRITKVIRTLKDIDSKVCGLLGALGQPLENVVTALPRQEHDSLLNGPQLPQNAVSQDDIDKLLSSF